MIKMISLLSKAFGVLLAIVTAFGVGWIMDDTTVLLQKRIISGWCVSFLSFMRFI